MKILKAILPLMVTIAVVWGAVDKPKKAVVDKSKKPGKRQIAYGLEAVPGLTFHAPLAEDGLLIAQPTAHGGYGLVQPFGFYAPHADGLAQGFNGFQGGYGLYAPQVVTTVDVQKTHQLDNGWKGIVHGHGSIKHGHEIAQSLVKAAPYQDGVYDVAPILPIVPQFDFGKATNAVYSPNALVPTYDGFSAAGFGPVNHVQFNLQQGFPNGYDFAAFHGNQGIQVPSYHHTAGQVGHKGHGSISHGHQLASQGQQLAKKVHTAGGLRGFIGSHGPKFHQDKINPYNHQKFQTKSFEATTRQDSAPHQHNYAPPAPRLAPLHHAARDSTSRSTSYSTDFNAPQSSYSPDFNPSAGTSSQTDGGRTNSNAGHDAGEKKATSFQSFIIHSYKPHPVGHKTKHDSLESDENFSGANYNSAQAFSGENRS